MANHYLIDIKNDPANTDIEHNYDEDEAPVSVTNILLIGEMDGGKTFAVTHHISIGNLADLFVAMEKANDSVFTVLKSAMILAEARLKVLELAKKRSIGDFFSSLAECMHSVED